MQHLYRQHIRYWAKKWSIPAGIAQKMAVTGRFLKRTMEEYEAMKVEIEVLKAEVGEVELDGQKVQKA